jgi:hypothetical protein
MRCLWRWFRKYYLRKPPVVTINVLPAERRYWDLRPGTFFVYCLTYFSFLDNQFFCVYYLLIYNLKLAFFKRSLDEALSLSAF